MTGSGSWSTWREAWQRALYGPAGFYRRELPRDHFRTSVHASHLFASALVQLTREHGLGAVTDAGAGGGELLAQVHAIAPDLRLAGIDVRPRPPDLDPAVGWHRAPPARLTGLVVANELLDNLPCTVIELDEERRPRVVEVNPSAEAERLGPVADHPATDWIATWWPSGVPGDRIEVGIEREDFWASICDRTTDGLCLAIDYGHLREARPSGGTLASYLAGRLVPVSLDGRCDVTAHVAVDALAARVGGSLETQGDALARLGLTGRRPPIELASRDPAGYVRALARAGNAAELTASPGLGDFWWLLTPRP